jgi:integrase
MSNTLVSVNAGGGELAVAQKTVEAARTYVRASKAENTLRAYETGWSQWAAWARAHNADVARPAPEAVALFLAAVAAAGAASSTVTSRLAAILHYARAAGSALDAKHPAIAAVLEGVRRTHGTAPRRQAKAVEPDDLRNMVATLPNTLAGVRDRAILMLGFAAAMRRSEVAALDVEDIAIGPQGAEVTIRRSKTDQHGAGATLAIHRGRDPRFCPVAAVEAWIARASIASGPLFRPIVGRGGCVVAARRIDAQSISLIVKRAAARAGLDPAAHSGHSLRAGFCTSAALKGHDLPAIMRQSRHKTTSTAAGYVRVADRWRDNPTADLF